MSSTNLVSRPAHAFFFQPVDLRSRQSMTDFLRNHFRYDTMGSNNRCSSYAQRIKVHHLGLNRQQLDNAYEILDTENWFGRVFNMANAQFTREQDYQYTIGSNGRSGGYLVMYNAHRKQSEHKSQCNCCGQLNFAKVIDCDLNTPEGIILAEVIKNRGCWIASKYLEQVAIAALSIWELEKLQLIEKALRLCRETKGYVTVGNRCGRCGAEGDEGRVNFDEPRYDLEIMPGRSIDQGEDFSDHDEWDLNSLRNQVRLVQAFDRACDVMRQRFIDLIDNFEVSEETIMVPQHVKRLKKRAA